MIIIFTSETISADRFSDYVVNYTDIGLGVYGDFEMVIPIIGYVSCGMGEEEQQQIVEYIRIPASLLGKGDFYALIAKGYSMIKAGIYPGDYVIVDKTKKPDKGDVVVALIDGRNNLKRLQYDYSNERYVLESCNSDKVNYPDIYTKSLYVQGVAVFVIHKMNDQVI